MFVFTSLFTFYAQIGPFEICWANGTWPQEVASKTTFFVLALEAFFATTYHILYIAAELIHSGVDTLLKRWAKEAQTLLQSLQAAWDKSRNEPAFLKDNPERPTGVKKETVFASSIARL